MGLRDDLLRMPFEQRFTYDPEENLFFVNFEGHVVRTQEDIERIRRAFETMLSPLKRKVHVIVNYDNFQIYPDIDRRILGNGAGPCRPVLFRSNSLHDQQLLAREIR